MLFLYAITCAVVAYVLTRLLNSWVLRPWRKAANEHWTEQARILFPIRSSASAHVLFLPFIAMVACMDFLENRIVGMPLVAGLTWVATVLATYPMSKETAPWIGFRPWIKEVIGSWTLFLGWIVIFAVVGVLMPREFSLNLWFWFLLFVGFLVYMNWQGFLPLLSAMGIIRKAPEPLVHMVERVSSRMRVKVRRVWLWQSLNANAMAFPTTGELLFSTRLLNNAPEPELEAVCAHELGHLSEDRSVVAMRMLGGISMAPLVLCKPMAHQFALPGVLVPILIWFLLSRLTKKMARKMEERADSVAIDDSNGQLYAKALERIYELNQAPAVMPKDNMIHPHLYDRLLAAGITPDYPRPEPAKQFTDVTRLFQVIFTLALFYLMSNLRS